MQDFIKEKDIVIAPEKEQSKLVLYLYSLFLVVKDIFYTIIWFTFCYMVFVGIEKLCGSVIPNICLIVGLVLLIPLSSLQKKNKD